MRPPSVGNDDRDTLLRHAQGDLRFARHAAAPFRRLAGLNVCLHPVARMNLRDKATVRVGGIAGIDASHVAQDNEQVGVHHLRHEPRQLVVVGKHQFSN